MLIAVSNSKCSVWWERDSYCIQDSEKSFNIILASYQFYFKPLELVPLPPSWVLASFSSSEIMRFSCCCSWSTIQREIILYKECWNKQDLSIQCPQRTVHIDFSGLWLRCAIYSEDAPGNRANAPWIHMHLAFPNMWAFDFTAHQCHISCYFCG